MIEPFHYCQSIMTETIFEGVTVAWKYSSLTMLKGCKNIDFSTIGLMGIANFS